MRNETKQQAMYPTPDFSPSTPRYVLQRTDTPFKHAQPSPYLLGDQRECVT